MSVEIKINKIIALCGENMKKKLYDKCDQQQ